MVGQSQPVIMPNAHRTSYNLAFKLNIVAEAEAVENNFEIAREYGISESMLRRWRKDQAKLFNGEIKLPAKLKTMGCFTPKYPDMDQRLLEWFSEQRSILNKFLLIAPCLLRITWSFMRRYTGNIEDISWPRGDKNFNFAC